MSATHQTIKALLDLVDILDLEPGPEELSITFFDRAVTTALDERIITRQEAEPLLAYIEDQT